uniref:Uncharacterized protein n=1 Tax=Rhizophora mucronata TaxID=61149 RepID=A0A2P2KB92_RHIMU
MKTLQLSNNGLKSLPSTLLKMCVQLSTLDLHNTEITMDVLRQVPLTICSLSFVPLLLCIVIL